MLTMYRVDSRRRVWAFCANTHWATEPFCTDKLIQIVSGTTTYFLKRVSDRFHLQTLMIDKLGFNKNYYTCTLISLIKIVLISKFP